MTRVLKVCSIILLFSTIAAFTTPEPLKFKVDTKASTLIWTGRKVTGEHYGNVPISAGALTVEGNIIKQGNFEIDLNALSVTDIENAEYNAKLVAHLKNEDFFNVSKFPKAAFVITSVAPIKNDEYTVKGKLTIKGITNNVEFPAVIKHNGQKLEASGKIKVNRTQYDIKFHSPSFFENLGDKAIYDEFELDLKLVANKDIGA